MKHTDGIVLEIARAKGRGIRWAISTTIFIRTTREVEIVVSFLHPCSFTSTVWFASISIDPRLGFGIVDLIEVILFPLTHNLLWDLLLGMIWTVVVHSLLS